MDDGEFVSRIQQRIEESTGSAARVRLDHENRRNIAVEFTDPATVLMGADALVYPGLARVFTQYAILCLREGRTVEQRDFTLFLRRN